MSRLRVVEVVVVAASVGAVAAVGAGLAVVGVARALGGYRHPT